MKTKKLYTLESRTRINQHENRTKTLIGIFSTPGKCHKWVIDHDKEFNSNKSKHFYAILESKVNDFENTPILYEFLDRNGRPISVK